LVTAAAVFLFILGIGVDRSVRPYLVAVFFAMFGIGSAAKVSSTLAMINDHSNLANRAQLRAFFDLVTFGGLVAGFGAAFLAIHSFHVADAIVLAVGGLGVTVSVVMVLVLVQETPFTPDLQRGTIDLLRTVLRNKDIQRLLPVYIPVVALATRPGSPDLEQLVSPWPLIVVLAAGAGTFPPAALAYLGDIVEHAVTGTTFGIYSIIFGSGLIVGPVLGGALTQALGPIAFAVIALGLIGISGTGVLFIREPLKTPRTAVAPESPIPPETR